MLPSKKCSLHGHLKQQLDMDLIRKQADSFITRELNKMEFQDTYHVVVNALKIELTNYYKPTDKLVFLEQVEIKIREELDEHLKKCTNKFVCKEVQDYESMIFFIRQELEKNGIVDTDIFTRSEIEHLNTKLDQLFKEIKILKTGHQIIYDDIINEFDKLKKQYYLDKKTWRQVFFGKIFEMTLSGVVSESLAKKIVEVFGDIFTEEQLKRLLS
jgi:hypothetical protein